MKRREELVIFNMSFLDCISCGFGATVLIFMLMKHTAVKVASERDLLPVASSALENRILDDKQRLLALHAAIDDAERATKTGKTDLERLQAKRELKQSALPTIEESIEASRARRVELENELKALETKVDELRAASKDASGNAQRSVVGDGQRQYLSGLSVSGQRILILVDASASMLADTIVEAIRRRNMDTAQQLSSPKWKRSVAAADWLTSQLPATSQFQMYAFNETAWPLVPGSAGQWLSAKGGAKLDEAVAALRGTAPTKGTSLVNAFRVAGKLSPPPDAIYLITDGLPTQGEKPVSGTVSGRKRAGYFDEAVRGMSSRVPVNVILMPMEGDPKAAGYYWALAQRTGGAYLAPSYDWP